MKELSIEEKAKRYDEAIEIINDYYQKTRYSSLSCASNDIEVLEKAFPELKESEEEKIRKEMIFYFAEEIPQCSIQEHSDKMREFISWLKRQEVERTKLELKAGNSYFCYKSRWERADSETFKKGLIYKCNKDGVLDNFIIKNPEQHFIEIKDERIAWLEKQGEHAKFCDSIQVGDKVTRNEDGVLINLSQLKRVAKKDEKQGEQKTTDKTEPKFKVGDEIRTKNEESLIITRIDRCGYWSEDLLICNFDDADKWELVEQKPAWSEEDEDILNTIINHFKVDIECTDEDDIVRWLKFLKDRVQPKWEGSEEDEKMIRALVSMCDVWATSHQFYPKENKEMEALKTWLKSLRPQKQWKPSDNELEVLRLAAEKDGTCLMGLYEQLKKLK